MNQFRRLGLLTVTVCVVLASSGCSVQGPLAQSGTFDFVSPGGRTVLFYDPPSTRGTIGDLAGPDLMTDSMIRLTDFADSIMVINIWGSWCAPCRTETPELEAVYGEFQRRGVQFLGIDVRDNRDAARDFVTDRKVTYPSIYDPALRSLVALGNSYPTSVVPTTVILDRQHRVAAVYLMAVLADDLRPVLSKLIDEPRPKGS